MSPWMKWMRTTPLSSLVMNSMLSRLITLSPTRSNLLMVHLLPPKSRAGTPRRIPRPAVLCTTLNRVSRRGTVTARPYTSIMAHEDTVLEEAMDYLKEAGQRIRATQSLMRSEGMTEGENHRDLLTRLSTARHDRSWIPRGPASQGSLD